VPASFRIVRALPVAVLVTWVPLLVLSWIDRQFISGSAIPFLFSIGTHTRFLIAIPLFFAAERLFYRHSRAALAMLTDAGVVSPTGNVEFERTLASTMRWRNSRILDAVALVIVWLWITQFAAYAMPRATTTWRADPMGNLTLAGRWYWYISLPIFHFLFFRWCLRLLVWCRLLWRLNRHDLQLTPTHPDLAGGLGSLGVAHVALAPLALGSSSMVVATFVENILFSGVDIQQVILPLAGFVIGSTVVLVAPLVLFSARLFEAKQRGLLEYGRIAHTYVQGFDRKWVRHEGNSSEPLLGSADVQSLADLSNAFNVIRRMRLIPIALSEVATIGAAAVLPALPLLLLVAPLDVLVLTGLRTILQL